MIIHKDDNDLYYIDTIYTDFSDYLTDFLTYLTIILTYLTGL
jgi:hypothetical protein